MSIPNLIPHKTLYISGYIYSYYAFVFIFEFPEHISKHILQFHVFFFVNRLIGACQQEIRLYDRRSLEVSKLRKFRANRWHDAADVVTGLVEREIAGRDTRIKSVKFM